MPAESGERAFEFAHFTEQAIAEDVVWATGGEGTLFGDSAAEFGDLWAVNESLEGFTCDNLGFAADVFDH